MFVSQLFSTAKYTLTSKSFPILADVEEYSVCGPSGAKLTKYISV